MHTKARDEELLAEIAGYFEMLAGDCEAMAARGLDKKSQLIRAKVWRDAAEDVRSIRLDTVQPMTDIPTLIASLRAGTVTPADLDAAADALAGKVAVKPLAWELRAGESGPYYAAFDGLYGRLVEVPDEATCDAVDARRRNFVMAALEPAPLTAADALTVPEVRALVEAARFADQVARDLGWHRIYDVTGAALRGIGGAQ